MKLKNDKLKELMKEYANNNYNEFARQLGVDVSQLYKFITKGSRGGMKMINAVIAFCETKDLNYEEYIDI